MDRRDAEAMLRTLACWTEGSLEDFYDKKIGFSLLVFNFKGQENMTSSAAMC